MLIFARRRRPQASKLGCYRRVENLTLPFRYPASLSVFLQDSIVLLLVIIFSYTWGYNLLMARRKSVSDVPEGGLPSILERSPLLDRRELRSFTFTATGEPSKSVSAYRPQGYDPNPRVKTVQAHYSSKATAQPSKTITERETVFYSAPPGLLRTRSASHYQYSCSPQYIPPYRSSPAFRSSPQYRVNPAVRFDERLLPERMNYGIAGYNTSRPRSFSGVGEGRRGLVVRRPGRLQIWRLWTRRFREKVTRIRVRSVCSRLMMKFRRRH